MAVGRELQRRGHDVCMAVPPNLVDFARSVGLRAVPYGPDAHALWRENLLRNFWGDLFRGLWTIRGPIRMLRELWEPVLRNWGEMNATLTPLTEGADVLCAGLFFQDVAANVAEHYDIPFVALHYFPIRPNGQSVPGLPALLSSRMMAMYDWFCWRMNKRVEDTQRRQLGLPKAIRPSARRIAERGALEIQTYDEACFPGLAAEWAKSDGRRPFVGALTMELHTESDDEVAAWIASGTPPICFGFGSMTVDSPAETIEMISAACARLGERALVCSGWTDYGDVPRFDHLKVVQTVNYASVFPACRAVVHHGGSGTTAAGLRAGVPTLILWTAGDQPVWGMQLSRLEVGAGRQFSSVTGETLVEDLRRILAPRYVARARALAPQMSSPADSITRAVDLVESAARVSGFSDGQGDSVDPIDAVECDRLSLSSPKIEEPEHGWADTRQTLGRNRRRSANSVLLPKLKFQLGFG
jgi:UDP:flavonoid glycosyltransferase YjiC (YdhE family)